MWNMYGGTIIYIYYIGMEDSISFVNIFSLNRITRGNTGWLHFDGNVWVKYQRP